MLLVCGEKNKSNFEALFGFLCEEKKDLMFVCQGFCCFFYDSELSSWCGMSFQGKKNLVGQRSSDYSDAKVNIKYAVQ